MPSTLHAWPPQGTPSPHLALQSWGGWGGLRGWGEKVSNGGRGGRQCAKALSLGLCTQLVIIYIGEQMEATPGVSKHVGIL